MKLPNGAGSVTKLSGNRRKPYIARATIGWDYDEDAGTAKQKRVTIGTFATKKEALQALAEFAANPYDVSNKDLTMDELFKRWHAERAKMVLAKTSKAQLSIWAYCHDIYSMRVRDVRPRHLKSVIQNGTTTPKFGINAGQTVKASPPNQAKIKGLLNLLFDYAVEYELADKNYARAFSLQEENISTDAVDTRPHFAFSDDEMQALWNAVGTVRFADWIIIQSYMGWRPQELAILEIQNVNLEERYIIGGIKTKSGRARTVPIHSRILGLVKDCYDFAVQNNSPRLLLDLEAYGGNPYIDYDRYAKRFKDVMSELHLREHRPHDPRKTFVTNAKAAGVDEYALKRILGHSIRDVTEAVYTERSLSWLISEIEKIP